MDTLQNLEGLSLEQLFTEFDNFVAERPYLQDNNEELSLEDLFAEFDTLVAARPYLQD